MAEMKTGKSCQYRKINTLGPTGPARNVGGKLFRSVTVNLKIDRQINLFSASAE